MNHGPPVCVIHLTVRSGGGTHDGDAFSSSESRHVSYSPIEIERRVFTVLWTGWMLWWSGSFDRVNIIMLATCGGVTGYAWYRAMRWRLPRGRVPSRHGPRQ
ncbi:MAG TPA: hypothetical protein VGJ68_12290 [Bradyrhizobium sp.]